MITAEVIMINSGLLTKILPVVVFSPVFLKTKIHEVTINGIMRNFFVAANNNIRLNCAILSA